MTCLLHSQKVLLLPLNFRTMGTNRNAVNTSERGRSPLSFSSNQAAVQKVGREKQPGVAGAISIVNGVPWRSVATAGRSAWRLPVGEKVFSGTRGPVGLCWGALLQREPKELLENLQEASEFAGGSDDEHLQSVWGKSRRQRELNVRNGPL